ncbi:MAG: hypothetical protein M0C28_01295 [Candidatus Moduliflexus flocculans]|nr:hypothetical protein [Candidatus Moduliflexus flocculans]
MLGVAGEVFLEFTGKAGGLYNAFTFTEANGARIGAKRIEPFEPTEAQLREYAGTFHSEELDVRYVVTVRAGSLRIKPGLGEEVEAGPLKKDFFAAEAGSGSSSIGTAKAASRACGSRPAASSTSSSPGSGPGTSRSRYPPGGQAPESASRREVGTAWFLHDKREGRDADYPGSRVMAARGSKR